MSLSSNGRDLRPVHAASGNASPSLANVPSSTKAVTPRASTPEPILTQEAPLVQIGYFSSVYLRYDPRQWEAFPETQDQQLNPQGELVEALRHRTTAGCFLHDNLGRGAPDTWRRQDTDRLIGRLEYRVETWTDTGTQQPVLIVYQYPAGEPGTGTRIELVVAREAQGCIQSAEDVLALSTDLVSP